jgi:CubicO group peptidase (beta-lactamase class C family)
LILFDKHHIMTPIQKIARLWLLFASLSFSQIALTQTPPTIPFDCRDSIPVWMAKSHVPGMAIGILENGKLKTKAFFGIAMSDAPVNEQTYFNVASLTKPVTGLVALKLIDRGQLGLDEPLDKYWIDPDIRDDPRHKKLTTRIILSHQTGFSNWRSKDSGKLVFHFEPGTRFGYSGEGFEYLRKALENKFGKSLQQLADSLIFKPLAMKNTRFSWSDGMDTTRLALGHDSAGRKVNAYRLTSVNAADWLVTTLDDYSTFATHILAGAGLKPELWTLVSTPQVAMEKNSKEKMGLGWEVIENLKAQNGEYLMMHTGKDDGIATLVLLLPQSGRGLLIFTNGDKGFDVVIHLLRAMLPIEELINQ